MLTIKHPNYLLIAAVESLSKQGVYSRRSRATIAIKYTLSPEQRRQAQSKARNKKRLKAWVKKTQKLTGITPINHVEPIA